LLILVITDENTSCALEGLSKVKVMVDPTTLVWFSLTFTLAA